MVLEAGFSGWISSISIGSKLVQSFDLLIHPRTPLAVSLRHWSGLLILSFDGFEDPFLSACGVVFAHIKQAGPRTASS